MRSEHNVCLCKECLYVSERISNNRSTTCNTLFPSRSSRPLVPVCFSCNQELYTLYTVIGGMIRVDFNFFESQKRFNKLKSFDFDLSFVITLSATFVKQMIMFCPEICHWS